MCSENLTDSSVYVAAVTKTAADNVPTDPKMAYGERGGTKYYERETEACHQIRSL